MIASGILLQLKKEVPWIQPPTMRGTSNSPSISMDAMLAAAQSQPEAGVREWSDIERIDVQPDRGMAKIHAFSRWEIQVDLKTGEVLQLAYRRSDLIESLHDGSFFHDRVKLWVFLPTGVIVFGLWISGFTCSFCRTRCAVAAAGGPSIGDEMMSIAPFSFVAAVVSHQRRSANQFVGVRANVVLDSRHRRRSHPRFHPDCRQPSGRFPHRAPAKMTAPPAAVFAQINDFHNWPAWSPWAKLDPTMKDEYSGASSGVGASYWWSGNSKVGEGRMTIEESRPNDLIRIKLAFLRPFKSTNMAHFEFKPEGNQTNLDWIMIGRHNFISKAFCMFMDMDKMIGKDFEKGWIR